MLCRDFNQEACRSVEALVWTGGVLIDESEFTSLALVSLQVSRQSFFLVKWYHCLEGMIYSLA